MLVPGGLGLVWVGLGPVRGWLRFGLGLVWGCCQLVRVGLGLV